MTKTPIDRVIKPVSKLFQQEYTSGISLFLCVVAALIWVNSAWGKPYHHVWKISLSMGFNRSRFDRPLHVWINDGLMAIFIFVIGLELEREFMAGELSNVIKAALPMVAALGGMLVPAAIYFAFNAGTESAGGWGIPMATDIAFLLGLLSLSGKYIPSFVKIFLSALAVADDLGAVLVIAFFYTAHIEFGYLAIGAGLLVLLIGITVWACLLFSGVHATVTRVLFAFAIPAQTKIDEQE